MKQQKKQSWMQLMVGTLLVMQNITLTRILLHLLGYGRGHKLKKSENIFSVNNIRKGSLTMLRWIAIVFLSVGIFSVGLWGYKEHEEKNAILIQAENTYQRAFHELSYHMDLLYDKIGISLAMNSNEQLSPQLVEVWRLTSEAHGNVSQLPLSLLPFSRTEEFLSEIGDFTYQTAVRDLEKTPLTEEEQATLNELYDQAKEIKEELREVQYLTLKDNLRWMDVQLALATEDEPLDNTIIDGFKTVEKKVEGYAEGYTDSPIFSDT